MAAELASSGLMSVQADVQTLSVRLGVKRVFWACIMLLELAYAGAIGLGALSQVTLHTCCLIGTARQIKCHTTMWHLMHQKLQHREVRDLHLMSGHQLLQNVWSAGGAAHNMLRNPAKQAGSHCSPYHLCC